MEKVVPSERTHLPAEEIQQGTCRGGVFGRPPTLRVEGAYENDPSSRGAYENDPRKHSSTRLVANPPTSLGRSVCTLTMFLVSSDRKPLVPSAGTGSGVSGGRASSASRASCSCTRSATNSSSIRADSYT